MRTPKPISALLDRFRPANMGPELKRGLVLRVYKSKIRDVVKNKRFAADIVYASLQGPDDQLELIVKLRPGSYWRPELHAQREPIRRKINARCEEEFIKRIQFR